MNNNKRYEPSASQDINPPVFELFVNIVPFLKIYLILFGFEWFVGFQSASYLKKNMFQLFVYAEFKTPIYLRNQKYHHWLHNPCEFTTHVQKFK